MKDLEILKGKPLIPIKETTKGNMIVNARDLHTFLEVGTRFNDWITRKIKKYGFVENVHFSTITQNRVVDATTKDVVEYILTLDTAKQLSMVEENEKGMQAREYFIAVEKAWNNPDMVVKRAVEILNKRVQNLTFENTELKRENIEQNK